ncbi:tetratricopeptide repeat protein [Asticcacaulis tiandongensis]|uniref:tetratricopeptide repeat protein n=1 Tax=Asticcacaulis tiandongensis TaxID=2565365 RepID=UPI00112B5477|nr:tetratricopeptide repeat protein [Asticcacaulis tiandongensis]
MPAQLTLCSPARKTAGKYLLTGAAMLAFSLTPLTASTAQADFNRAYGQYLIGKYAIYAGDTQISARALMESAESDPDNRALQEKAFLSAVLGGYLDFAADNAPQSDSSSRFSRMVGHEVKALRAIRANKPREALPELAAALDIDADERSGLLLQPAAYAMAGQWDKAIDKDMAAKLTGGLTQRDGLMLYLQAADQARLLELRGKHKEAEALYKLICEPGPATVLFGPYYGAFLERRGRKSEAEDLYASILSSSEDAQVRRAYQALERKGYRKPPKPSYRQIMADNLFMTGTLYASEQQPEMALATLRMAQYASPETDSLSDDRTRLLLGQVLVKLRDHDSAQAEWAQVAESSVYYNEARLRMAWSLKEQDDHDGALALFSQLSAENPADIDLVVQRVSLLWEKKDYQAGLEVLEGFVAAQGEEAVSWQGWFIQAIIYHELDQWERSEAALKKGLALDEENPDLLNFLGYGWIERNQNLDEALSMVQRALIRRPDSGAIMDSVGWGYYRQGEYAEALEWIEKAIALEPADPEVNEHLGDVYQAMGRHIEARYQWARVLTLDADEKQIASVQKKLDAAAKMPQPRLATAKAP